MFRVPLVWAAIVAVSVGALSVGMPADHALRTFAIGMIGVSVPLGLAVIFKRAQRTHGTAQAPARHDLR